MPKKAFATLLLILLTSGAAINADWKMGAKFSQTNLFGPPESGWAPLCTFKGGEGLWAKGDRSAWGWVNDQGKLMWMTNSNILESTLTFGGTRELWVNRDSLFLVDARSWADNRLGFDIVLRRVTSEGIQDMQTLTGDRYRTLAASWNRKWPYFEEGIWLRRGLYPISLYPYPGTYGDVEWEFWNWVPVNGPLVVLTAVARDGEVGVSWLAEIGRTYQVQVTADLQTWEDHGARIFGDNTHARVVMVDPGCRLVRVIAFEWTTP